MHQQIIQKDKKRLKSLPLLIYPDYGAGGSSAMLVCFHQVTQSNGSHHNYNSEDLCLKSK